MKLVQLSDLHIGGAFFRQDVFDTIVDEVSNKLKPDTILITGDLTDDGLASQFERARMEINKLVDSCPNVLILPGNHDYRHTGYLLFKKFFGSSSSPNVYDFEDTVIITLATARPDKDEGEVGYRQNLWLEKILSNEKYINKTTKVIAMHHHLIGIPDTGTDKIIIVDAGDVLRTCLQYKVDLVLCGHKHRPWLWNLEALEIAYAGTATSARFRGFFKNAYNIIDIKDDGKVSVDIKIVDGKRFPLLDVVKNYYRTSLGGGLR